MEKVANQFHASTKPKTPKIGLALQGAGAQGSFTWGVIHELLESGIEIGAICGSSSGALNGALAAHGLARGDKALAIATMQEGWNRLSKMARGTPFHATLYDSFTGSWPNLSNPYYMASKQMIDKMPVDVWNPTGRHPLREMLNGLVDFEAIRNSRDFQLFVSAVDPKIQQLKVFTGDQINLDTVSASSNLPKMMPPVRVDGREFWDGGFMENPSVTPLAQNSDVTDILLVMVTPSEIETLPTRPDDIEKRTQQILYASGPYKDMAWIARMNDLIRDGKVDPAVIGERSVHLHRVVRPPQDHLNGTSADNLDMRFLLQQHALGRQTARTWLKDHASDLGQRSTFDPRDEKNGVIRPHGFVYGQRRAP